MADLIHCPKCGFEFEALAQAREQLEAELRTRLQGELAQRLADAEERAEGRVQDKERELEESRRKLAAATTREAGLLKQQREVEEREQQLALDLERKLAEGTKRIREQEAKAAEERFARVAEERARGADQELADVRQKLSETTAKEADLLRKQREVEAREQQLALDLERKLTEETKRIREQLDEAAEQRAQLDRDKLRLLDEEHKHQLGALERKLGELQQRLQRGSQQVHGEVQEVVLRDLLTEAFDLDRIEDVPKGVQGADVVQRVYTPDGREHGTIIWESKRTKAWSDDWLPKLRDDRRTAGAHCAIVVSQALPPDINHFGERGGVWICGWPYGTALAAALRATLIEVSRARRMATGRGEKMQMTYDYLTGAEFRNRVSGLVEAIQEMQHDLEREKRAMLGLWKRREKQLLRARNNVTAFYGDLQGIAGRQLADLPVLSLEAPAGDFQVIDGRQLADLPQLAPPSPTQAPDAAPLDREGPDRARPDGAVAGADAEIEEAEPEDAEIEDTEIEQAELEEAELEEAEPEDAFLELFPNDGTPSRGKPAVARLPLGAKRPPGELIKLTEKLGGYIKANPGRGIEAIGSALVMPTSELSLPIKKLLAAQKIRSEGAKRATKYFPV